MTKEHEIIFAGFGGQGVLSMGRLIAYSGMIEDKEVSWMPSYGPEMRGGTANCIVIVSDARISSPIVTKFDTAILLNQPSIDKFENAVKPGGLLIYEQSTAVRPPARTDIDIIAISGNEEAAKLGAKQVANMFMVGAFLEKRPILTDESIVAGLKKALPERRHNLIPVNEQALSRGRELAKMADQVSA
ncbi:MAG: 2-oxoacid:acceptor oxidoreductase family protein [Ignavibacteriaceae bacterium]|jgi:2-oxoglutarate ferredoxin oxidoreductase subunit gamma|nr:2-oxoacid:acceptor oxidoreductase family protein [Ignavibacteriaceae bacterium]